MAEKNMSEKLAETILKLIKKTNTFEKIETQLNNVSLFIFITGAVTLYNSYKLHKITEYSNIFKNKMDDKINSKLDKIIETNEKIIHLQMQLYTSFQNNEVLKKQVSLTKNIKTQTIVTPLEDIETQTIVTPLEDIETQTIVTPLEDIETQTIVTPLEDIENIKTQTTVSPLEDYNELLNECYDNIPCNNSKKASGLNRLFVWK